MLGLLLPLILLNYIRNLQLLAPFSTVANLLTFVGLGLVLYFVFAEGLPGFENVQLFGTLEGIPRFIGTTLFALEAVGVVRTKNTIELNALRKQWQSAFIFS